MNEGPQCRLLIVGASARAAAMSAIRSGFEPWAADRFADLDLAACAAICPVADYPAGLERAISTAPPGPWIYTGALENRPDLIEQLSRNRTLLGIVGEALRNVRDPFRLAAALEEAGLKAPRCARSDVGLPRDGSWLCKPLASAGGCGISAWHGDSPTPSSKPRFYFQQRIEGLPVGAIYVATNHSAELIGVTTQLIGLDWCGLSPDAGDRFRYCGSTGPLRLSRSLEDRFDRIGTVLADVFDLRGLFGVDAIIAGAGDSATADGDVWPVEVNPRYTASVEILERALGVRSIALHVAACGGEASEIPPTVRPNRHRSRHCGKSILFARSHITVGPEFPKWCRRRNQNQAWPVVADIPAIGSKVRAGQPIVTVLADGAADTAVLAKLESLAAAVYREIEICRN